MTLFLFTHTPTAHAAFPPKRRFLSASPASRKEEEEEEEGAALLLPLKVLRGAAGPLLVSLRAVRSFVVSGLGVFSCLSPSIITLFYIKVVPTFFYSSASPGRRTTPTRWRVNFNTPFLLLYQLLLQGLHGPTSFHLHPFMFLGESYRRLQWSFFCLFFVFYWRHDSEILCHLRHRHRLRSPPDCGDRPGGGSSLPNNDPQSVKTGEPNPIDI